MSSSHGKAGLSFIHRIDPRIRLAVAFSFAVLIVLVERFAVLGAALAVSFLFVLLARSLTRSSIRRIAGLNGFMLMLAILLPLTTPGTPMAQFGPLSWSQPGLLQAALIALKANAILAAFIALAGTIEHAHLGFALNGLGMPEKLTHIMLFKVRYLGVIQREYQRLREAMRLRAFRPRCNRHTFRVLGYLIGMLLIRSLDRAERVHEAMKCRGFRGRFYVLEHFRIASADVAFAAVSFAGLIALGCMEWI